MGQETRLKDDVILNSLLASTSNKWYGDMLMVVAQSGIEGEDLNGVRKFMTRKIAERTVSDPLDIVIDMEKLEDGLSFHVNVGLLEKFEDGHYHWTSQARRHWKTFEQAWIGKDL